MPNVGPVRLLGLVNYARSREIEMPWFSDFDYTSQYWKALAGRERVPPYLEPSLRSRQMASSASRLQAASLEDSGSLAPAESSNISVSKSSLVRFFKFFRRML